MKALFTSALALLFAVSLALSQDQPAEKKTGKKTVRVEKARGGAWLGVALGDYSSKTDDNTGKQKKSSAKEGAIVQEVVDDSPADSVGLKEDDIIIELNGKPVSAAEDVVTRIGAMKAGEKATITVLREDAKKTFTAVLGSRPREMSQRFEMRMPSMRQHMNIPAPGHPFGPMMMMHHAGVEGMQLMELRDQLGRYFEAPDGKALLVTEVKKNSNARKAGIEAGDVIIKVGSTDIEDMGDLHQALKDAKEGTPVDVEIIRKGAHKTMKLEVSKPDDDEMGMMQFNEDFMRPEDFHFNFDNFHFNREELRNMMRKLQPELEKIKPELDRIKKEIRIRTHGEEVNVPSVPATVPAPGTEL